jgi:hypothetical protein
MTLTFPSPRPCAEGRLHSTGGIAAHSHSLEDPRGPFLPTEGSKPGSAVSSRSSAASKEVLATDHSPASSTSRGAPRRASVSPDTASSCGRLTAANRSRRSRSRRFALDDDRHRRTPDHAGTAHPAVKAGADEPPTREHGRWQFAGSDYKRKAAKWRCPTKERKPGSRWIKASRLHTLIPRQRPLAQALPRTCRR